MSRIFRIKKIMSLERCKHIFINGEYAKSQDDILALIKKVIDNNIDFDIFEDNDTAYVNTNANV
jgi:hypothetical protein